MNKTAKLILGLLAFSLWPLLAFAQDGSTLGAIKDALPAKAVDAGSIVAPLLIVGFILKNAWPAFPNRFIPLTMFALGIPAYMIKAGASWTDGDALVTAFMCVATAVGTQSGIKNTFGKDEGDPKPAGTTLGLFVILGLCAALLTGCGTTAAQAIVTVDSLVEGGMKEWSKAHNDGLTTERIDADVNAAYQLYQDEVARVLPLYEAAIAAHDVAGKFKSLAELKTAADAFLDELVPILAQPRVDDLKQELATASIP